MAEELCKDVESGVEPSLDRGKAELLLQYYKKRFGSLKVKERNVLLDTSYIFDAEELIELHEKLESAKQAEKQYKSDIKEKTLAIAKAADGASTAYIPYGKTGKYVQVSLRSSVRKSSLVDVDKVYEKYPEDMLKEISMRRRLSKKIRSCWKNAKRMNLSILNRQAMA